MNHAEFVDQFRVPDTLTRAYRFGLESAQAGHGSLTFDEFFRNDPIPRINKPSKSMLWRAYRAGRRDGKVHRLRATDDHS
jgi:hypothetical protein